VTGAAERFADAARARGLRPDVRRFPEGTRTAADAAAAIGCDVGQIVKSLVFVADDEPVLALTSGSNRVDPVKLAARAAATSVRRATAEEARAATGFAVGGTPPFGHSQPIRAFLDEDLLAYEQIWAAAGTPDGVFALSPAELRTAAGATIVDLAERGPSASPGSAATMEATDQPNLPPPEDR
jgi:prolyl-tRNA editing enzyme YbaK/EbsC (Cys-tRNA(Pro) deacylase)